MSGAVRCIPDPTLISLRYVGGARAAVDAAAGPCEVGQERWREWGEGGSGEVEQALQRAFVGRNSTLAPGHRLASAPLRARGMRA